MKREIEMGYRSCVAGALKFKEAHQATNYLNSIKFEKYMSDSFFVSDKTICFYIDWVKWYEDYPDVKQVINFFQDSSDAEGFVGYELHRFGEEYEDYEYESCGEYIGKISFIRSLSFD